jgi:hypothetical protein
MSQTCRAGLELYTRFARGKVAWGGEFQNGHNKAVDFRRFVRLLL